MTSRSNRNSTTFKFEFKFPPNFLLYVYDQFFKINLKFNFQTLLVLNYEFLMQASSGLWQIYGEP